MSCSWRFTNLNVVFHSVVGEPTQTLHVYSDVPAAVLWAIVWLIYYEKSSTSKKDEGPFTLNPYTFNTYHFATKWLKSFKHKSRKPMENSSSLEKGTPLWPYIFKKYKTRRARKHFISAKKKMRGGNLTRFRPDEYYQDGKGVIMDVVLGGLRGLKSTRNPLKLPSNT